VQFAYFTIYSNTQLTPADSVDACFATLAYSRPVMISRRRRALRNAALMTSQHTVVPLFSISNAQMATAMSLNIACYSARPGKLPHAKTIEELFKKAIG